MLSMITILLLPLLCNHQLSSLSPISYVFIIHLHPSYLYSTFISTHLHLYSSFISIHLSIPPYLFPDRAAICLANLINSRLGAAAVTPQSTSSSRSMSPNRSAARWRGQSPAGNTSGGPIPGLQLEELGLNDNPLLGSSGICALLGR